MMQTLRTKSKYIGAGILALMLVPLLFSTFSGESDTSTVPVEQTPTMPAVTGGKPAPAQPVVYHFDESTQSWVSPGHEPLPLQVEPAPPQSPNTEVPPASAPIEPASQAIPAPAPAQ